MPESCRICGEPTAPAERITSPRGARLDDLAVLPELHADRAPAVEQHLLDQRAGLEPQVRPLQHRLQEAARRRPAQRRASG